MQASVRMCTPKQLGFRILFFFFLITSVTNCWSQTYFRTRPATSDSWNSNTLWQSSPDNFTWANTTDFPTSDAAGINIQAGCTVTVSTGTRTMNNVAVNGTLIFSGISTKFTMPVNGIMNINTNGIVQFNTGSSSGPPPYTDVVNLGAGTIITINDGGKITVGDGKSFIGSGMNKFATESNGTYVWKNGSTFEWNTTSPFASSNVTYFPNVAPSVTPIFIVTKAGAIGSNANNPTNIFGLTEINTNLTWQNGSVINFRNGIRGSGNINFLNGATITIGDKAGVNLVKANIGGTGNLTRDLNVNNQPNLALKINITNGCTATLLSSKNISNATLSINVNGVLDAGLYQVTGVSDTLIVNGTVKTSNPNGFSAASNGSIPLSAFNLVRLASGSMVDYTSSSAQTITANNYYNLTNSGSGTKSLVSDVTVGNNLTLTDGTLSIGSNTLTVNGVISGSGSLAASSTSNLITAANSTVNFASNSNTLHNLTISNGTLTLGNALDITGGTNYGVITIANGAKLITNDHLILKSTNAGTAAIASNTSGSAYITGKVTAERYITKNLNSDPNRTGRAWRLLTAPVLGTTIGAAWQEGVLYDGNAFHVIGSTAIATPAAGYGTMITGYKQATSANANNHGYDFWSAIPNGNSSIRYYLGSSGASSEGTWNSFDNINNQLIENQPAYMLFIRGDRFVTTESGSTTLRAIGTPNQVSKSYTVSPTNSYSLVGNPFPSTIDFGKIYEHNSSVIQNRFYVWDSKLSTYGAYILVQGNGSSYKAIPTNLAEINDNSVRFIPSSAGFFVSPNAGGTLSILETDKAASSTPYSNPFKEEAETEKKLFVNLNLKDSDTSFTLADGLLISFDKSYSNKINNNDVAKLPNFNENLSILHDSINLMSEKRSDITNTDTVQLKLINVTKRNYQLQLKADKFTNGVQAWLEDNYLGSKQPVDLSGGITTADFTITSDSASWKSDRFRVVFQNNSVLPVTLTSVKAAPLNGGVQVSWTVTNEVNMKGYTIERSTDGGSTYSVIATQTAKNNTAAALTNYAGFDAAPQQGDNLYRIRIESKAGNISYSKIVKVTLGEDRKDIQITMYPNPVRKEGKVNLQLTNLAEGSYLLRVYSEGGQSVYQRKVTISQSNTTQSETLSLGSHLAQGSYQVHITNSKGVTLFTDKLIITR